MAIAVLLFFFPIQIFAVEPDQAKNENYQLKTWTIGSSALVGASASYDLQGTFGQTSPIGVGSNGSQEYGIGFWPVALIHGPTSPVSEVPHLGTKLFPVAPNPFNPLTNIRFTLSKPGDVSLTIFDLRGRRVRILVSEWRGAGHHDVVWNGRDDIGRTMASGTYFCKMETEGYMQIAKMLLVK